MNKFKNRIEINASSEKVTQAINDMVKLIDDCLHDRGVNTHDLYTCAIVALSAQIYASRMANISKDSVIVTYEEKDEPGH